MSFLSIFLNKATNTHKNPWEDHPSIFDHIKNNVTSSGDLSAVGNDLPDDSRHFKENDLRWASGAMDSIFSHHTAGNQKAIDNIANLIKKISETGRLKDKVKLYNYLVEDDLMSFIDPTLEKITTLTPQIDPHLHSWVQFLAFKSPDRGAVKFGIALLGLIQNSNNIENLMILGKHEEFTLFVAVAISNILEEPDTHLWQLAQNVHGWGRIHLVERLADTQNPEIRKWLLYEGYKNHIMYEYLAYTCAVSGDLKTELVNNNNPKLIQATEEILEALITGGPAEDISDYKDASEVIQLYLKYTIGELYTLNHFVVLDTIRYYLQDEDNDWDKLASQGWTPDYRIATLNTINNELSLPIWHDLVNKNKNTDDDTEFWQVKRTANALNIDLWEVHWQRLQQQSTNSGHWFDIMQVADQNRIDQIIEFAESTLDLGSIATGAKDELGLGKEYQLHGCLDFILQDLDRFPLKGKQLIITALNSPVVRNRNMAIKALNHWGISRMDNDIKQAIATAKKTEPNKDTKKGLENLLKGKTLDW